jgi:anti-repressor protein
METFVTIQDGKPITNSLLVAQKFGKEHKNVIGSIRVLFQSAENSADLTMFWESMYSNLFVA